MKDCERCITQGKICSYDVWDRCAACSESGHSCWPPINLVELMIKTRELRTLRSDAEHLRTVLRDKATELKRTHEEFLQCRAVLSQDSSEADKLHFVRLREQGKSLTEKIKDDEEKHGILCQSIQDKDREKGDIAHALADMVLDRFARDCEHCVRLQRMCDIPENSQICTACRNDVVRCTGDADWAGLDMMWNVADPIDQQVDAFLLNNLSDPTTFQKLKDDEASAWALLETYVDRSGLSKQEQQEASRLGERRRQLRKSLEQVRSDSFHGDVTYQELWSLREVLTICGDAASRWWSDYNVELNEWTGYPTQRNLPDVEEMTEEEFRDAVTWVQKHPLYKYDECLSSGQSSDGGNATGGQSSPGLEGLDRCLGHLQTKARG